MRIVYMYNQCRNWTLQIAEQRAAWFSRCISNQADVAQEEKLVQIWPRLIKHTAFCKLSPGQYQQQPELKTSVLRQPVHGQHSESSEVAQQASCALHVADHVVQHLIPSGLAECII